MIGVWWIASRMRDLRLLNLCHPVCQVCIYREKDMLMLVVGEPICGMMWEVYHIVVDNQSDEYSSWLTFFVACLLAYIDRTSLLCILLLVNTRIKCMLFLYLSIGAEERVEETGRSFMDKMSDIRKQATESAKVISDWLKQASKTERHTHKEGGRDQLLPIGHMQRLYSSLYKGFW